MPPFFISNPPTMSKTKQISITEYCKEYKKVSDRAIRKAVEKNNLKLLPQVISAVKIGKTYVLTVSY